MNERPSIPKAMRFEVFKRDSFTCQYCGAKSPEVVLHCDHIKPVAEGGATELLNLVTACLSCNLGKGARQLDDMSAIERQRRQIEELNERRQQLEMMLEWRDELAKHTIDEIEVVCDAIAARSKFVPNDKGKLSVRRWVKKNGLSEVLAAADEAFDLYLKDDTLSAWEVAFARIPRMLSIRQQEKTDPHIRKLVYIQAIMRNRFDDPYGKYVERVRDVLDKGYPIDVLESCSKNADSWNEYVDLLTAWSKHQASTKPTADETEEEEDAVDEEESRLIQESFAAWDDPEFHIHMFAQCLPGRARSILQEMAKWTAGQSGGYIEGGVIHPDNVPVLRGMRAIGLIQPTHRHKGILIHRGGGRVEPTFCIPILSPRETVDAFNRFGALRLSFWGNPRAFARVDEVH